MKLFGSQFGKSVGSWANPPTGDPKYFDFMFSGIEPPK